MDWFEARPGQNYKCQADELYGLYYYTVYMRSVIEKVWCNKPAIRDALAATKMERNC